MVIDTGVQTFTATCRTPFLVGETDSLFRFHWEGEEKMGSSVR